MSNNIDQIYENLMSIKYSNWTWFVTDDFSPDNTKSKLLNKIQIGMRTKPEFIHKQLFR